MAEVTPKSPFDVACPRCGAGIGRRCKTKTGYTSNHHAGRWKAIGIDHPTGEDRQRAWEAHQKLRLAQIEYRYAKIQMRLTED